MRLEVMVRNRGVDLRRVKATADFLPCANRQIFWGFNIDRHLAGIADYKCSELRASASDPHHFLAPRDRDRGYHCAIPPHLERALHDPRCRRN